MKYFFASSLIVLSIFIITISCKNSPEMTTDTKGIAVVELFTSQGCSSCPPADELLGRYVQQNNSNIICLSFHVDYWNRLGWRDVFSSAAFSQRQSLYDQNLRSQTFTPQAVINGSTQFVGSDGRNINNAIARMTSTSLPAEIQSQQSVQGNDVSVDYTLSGNYNGDDVVACLVQNKAATKIGAGENDGRMLDEYNVVRDYKIVNAASEKGNVQLKIPSGLKAKDCSIVLLVQQKNQGTIIGAKIIAI